MLPHCPISEWWPLYVHPSLKLSGKNLTDPRADKKSSPCLKCYILWHSGYYQVKITNIVQRSATAKKQTFWNSCANGCLSQYLLGNWTLYLVYIVKKKKKEPASDQKVMSSIPGTASEPELDPLTINSSLVFCLTWKSFWSVKFQLKLVRDQPQIMQFGPWASDEQELSRCDLGNGELSVDTPSGCQHVTDISQAHLWQ